MEYFNHDTGAAADVALCGLRLQLGGAAVDAYWTLLELIYRDEEDLHFYNNPTLTRVVSHMLCVDEDTLFGWVAGMLVSGLFKREGDNIYSERARENIESYHARVESARERGRLGGRPKKATEKLQVSNSLATGKQQQSNSLANKIKENKSVGFDKQNQTLTPCESGAEDGADVAGEVPHCSACDAIAIFKPDAMCFVCPNCGTLHATEDVVFK